jgi:hypothetical protein
LNNIKNNNDGFINAIVNKKLFGKVKN